ncbi:hypothetical protein [Sporosarcina sp. SAFN-015]|uniref:hypothetical protein n=1 Tax=Sporosarcina sp. SAFN-015 TaxID=3387274 RepID=UPI003F819F76
MTTPAKRTIAIDAEYRLAFPDADNIVIERLITVDPTKSPAFDPDKHDATIRQEWRSVGKYFATIPRALTFLNEYKIRTGDATTLREVLDELRAFKAHVDALLSAEV